MVRRIYVEKRRGFDTEAQGLCEDLRENLHLQQLNLVRVLNRYDVEGIDDDTYQSAKYTVFAEPAIDSAYDEIVPVVTGSQFFAVEYLPGQYDQRADSAEQCIRLMNAEATPTVRFARLYILEGGVSESELAAIKNYCINPVDSREADLNKPAKLATDQLEPENVKTVCNFLSMSEEELADYREKQGFAMSLEDLKFVREYFSKEEKRDATVTELKVIDTYWSDHCRHTTFLTKIDFISFEEGPYSHLIQTAYEEYLQMRQEVYGNQERDVCLMDMAVIGAKYLKKKGLVKDLDESDEINACSIKVKALIDGQEEEWLVMFKNETHNHPTEIEPFGGAATCLGGAIRDPLSGRVYVYQAMRVTGSGDPRKSVEETLPGKLPQRKITRGAAKGYSSYGNQIGLATGQVAEIYHEGYVAKRMEVGAVIGAAPAKHVIRKKPAEGDYIILVGGRTGRDGCGGATGSSKEHTEDSILTCGAEVQKGNPPVERNIQRLFRREEAANLIKKCNDFGAGGVSVAIGELAESLDVNLDLVLKKYDGLDGTELAISESQERMAVVVSEEDYKTFISYAEEENLEAVAVARVTNTGRFRMFWQGNCILNLSRAFLDTNGVKQVTQVSVRERMKSETKSIDMKDHSGMDKSAGSMADQALEFVKSLNCCSQKGLVEMFDSTIGAATVLMPLGGKYQLSPAAGMAAKLPVTDGNTNTATLMTFGFDPDLSTASPYHGALYAVVDSVTKIAAMGGDASKVRLTFQEYFERLGQNAEKWAKPVSALLGALKAQKELGIPAIGGKDSMSGTFMDLEVPPTLVSFAVGVTEAEHVISTDLKKTNSTLIYLETERDENGILVFKQYRRNMEKVRSLAVEGKILSANTIGKGGVFLSLVKMPVGNQIGVSLDRIQKEKLFQENYGSLILEIDKRDKPEKLFAGVDYSVLGTTKEKQEFVIRFLEEKDEEQAEQIKISLRDILDSWTAPLEAVFPTLSRTGDSEKKIASVSYSIRASHKPAVKIVRPTVYIPVFPGTNCEMDSRRAFEKAGAVTDVQILHNLTPKSLTESIEEMAARIRKSQIIMIPGGFSGGDEPDGSAKFITAVFRNPQIKEAVTDLLENRDGLMLGICNGFQALIKLGLVPYGRITDTSENHPTLTYNQIGRHASCLVRTRIASVKSPWMANVEVGDIHTIPVSHGEGRFIAKDDVLDMMIKNGQIATQYVDLDGEPTLDIAYNPNDSTLAVEGITSPDGRILGKMGHSERIGENLYKNVPGSFDQKIFEAGVSYFK
jgi:phosphoribosylformylglycinamidine synthase